MTARHAAWAAAAFLACSGPATADFDIVDMWNAGNVQPGTVFPNWAQVYVGSYQVLLCNGCLGATETLNGLTVVNFGTATTADIGAVYWQVRCSALNSALFTMTYAGLYTEESGTYPAWTWAGASPNLATCGDLCGGTCGGTFTLNVYTDIAPCPTDLRTLKMGFPYHSFGGTALWWGSISDNNGYVLPWGDMIGEQQTVHVVFKQGPDYAAPGDTVTYTVTYGRPGTSVLSNIVVTDTLPPFVHYLAGGAVPAPDPGWDPDPGPPLRLRWTLPGGVVIGGATGQVTFKVTVDWGNGETFEPGSGDVAAPEGARLGNTAHVDWQGGNCPYPSMTTGQVGTAVRRFLFWKQADNDLLFSSSYGQPPDEITYELFLKNMSGSKTWWNVDVWDTVPPEVDPWGPGFGFEDPCGGWTMTPSGCAAATPGRIVAGGTTLLTWKLDMPPGLTLTLRWKAAVVPSATAGATALNRSAILERGRAGVFNGTGHSGAARIFTHQAPIVLPTTYTSYLGFGTADNFSWACASCPDDTTAMERETYFIVFYPLNKKTDFALYDQIHANDAFANFGGASPPINVPEGGCFTGGTDWIPGCKVERAPAIYKPLAYGACPSFTRQRDLYKLVSNAPLIWELLTAAGSVDSDNDQGTYSGTASLTYQGYTSYSYARVCSISADHRDGFYLVNTNTTAPTTMHAFWWDAAALAYTYMSSRDVGPESQWYFAPPLNGHWKVISGDGPLQLFKGFPALVDANGDNNWGSQVPNVRNGYLVPDAAPADFYGYIGGDSQGDNPGLVVGNWGAATAIYEVWQYLPANQTIPIAGSDTEHLTSVLVDSAGTWRMLTVDTVPPGLAAAGNAHAYGNGYGTLITDALGLYRIHLRSGGPIQVYGGRDVDSGFSSGHVLHAVDQQPSGALYWFHQAATSNLNGNSFCNAPHTPVMGLDFYCPKTGTVVQMTSGNGYTATYTTNGPDECVFFERLTSPAAGQTTNYRTTATGGIVVCAFDITCQMKQKLYTAPFLGQGVHYQIIAPPVAYVGQAFWITVIVVDVGNTTKTDYCGTTSFTSTDSNAKIENTAMDTYNYTWDSNDPAASCKGAGCANGCDNGVVIFLNVTLTKLGLQTLVGQDLTDGSINGLTTVMVVGVDVKLTKEPRLSIAASGDTVQFRVCWSNYSSGSAFSFVITDAVPVGTTFLPEATTAPFDCGNTDGVPVSVASSVTTSTTPPAAFTVGNPALGTRWLRWTVPMAGVGTTGCACYRVTVN